MTPWRRMSAGHNDADREEHQLLDTVGIPLAHLSRINKPSSPPPIAPPGSSNTKPPTAPSCTPTLSSYPSCNKNQLQLQPHRPWPHTRQHHPKPQGTTPIPPSNLAPPTPPILDPYLTPWSDHFQQPKQSASASKISEVGLNHAKYKNQYPLLCQLHRNQCIPHHGEQSSLA